MTEYDCGLCEIEIESLEKQNQDLMQDALGLVKVLKEIINHEESHDSNHWDCCHDNTSEYKAEEALTKWKEKYK